MKEFKNSNQLLPGILLSLAIAVVSSVVVEWLPVQFIGASILALFIGVVVRTFFYNNTLFQSGVQFTSKKILKFAIVLLGATLNVSIIMQVGSRTLLVLFFTLLTAFGGGYLLGKIFNVNSKLSNMIAAGTAICGGSAIAAVAPVIEADDGDVSYAISATFLFDMVMIVLYPFVGRLFALGDTFFGYWAGTSINDTSSVVAASFSFSDIAGEVATMVKLTRTLAIIPTVLVFSALYFRKQRNQPNKRAGKVPVRSLFPWFIVFFVGMALLNTVGLITPSLAESLRQASRFLMVVALAAIGLKTDIRGIVKTGWKPLVHSVILSTLVVFVSFFVVSVVIG